MGSTFDDQAAAYDRWFATPLGRLVDEVEKRAIFNLTPVVKGRRLLEVGCGTGNFSLTLVQHGARVVGLDCSLPMLARARAKLPAPDAPLTLVQGLADRLPFADETFGGVMCILALDFMSQRETALAEMTRVLRPGGFLIVAMLNRYSLWTAKRTIRSWFKPSLWREVRFITPKELPRLLLSQPELANIRRSQGVYFPPWANRRLFKFYPQLENMGARLNLPFAAFLVAAATKRTPTEMDPKSHT
jgi:ubiquinone/menaquinone biosynthesis C-methylase UbiE